METNTIVVTHFTQENLDGLTMFICQSIWRINARIRIFGPRGTKTLVSSFSPAVQESLLESVVVTEFDSTLELDGMEMHITPEEIKLSIPERRELDKKRIITEFGFSMERRELLRGIDVAIDGTMRHAEDYTVEIPEEIVCFDVADGLLQIK